MRANQIGGEQLPNILRDDNWNNIRRIIDNNKEFKAAESVLNRLLKQYEKNSEDIVTSDLEEILARNDVNSTQRNVLISARLGQGVFRQKVMERWGSACAVTSCDVPAVLQACHLKPWRDCTDEERLDPENGIILTANLHALLDAGLLQIDGTQIVPSDCLSEDARNTLGVKKASLTRPLNSKQTEYAYYSGSNR